MAGYIGSAASVVSSGAENKKTFTITGSTTSLTGLKYPVGKVHVFQNGVRLVDGTDYTATNGTSITLTVAAQSGDNVVVISQAAFQVADALLTSGGTLTGDLTVQGAFTSQGIDDNGNATALTIDSNENVMVGNTDPTPYTRTSGNAVAMGDGLISSAQSGGNAAIFNRMTNDGSIVGFRKDGSPVGSIGSNASAHLTMGSGDTGLLFNAATDKIHPWNMSTQGIRDNAVDLGVSVSRFKDLYLSGGVYLGGTGSANKLDDYESGDIDIANLTFTGSGSATTNTNYQTLRYTKVGQVVSITGNIYLASVTSQNGALKIPLPFTSGTGEKHRTASGTANASSNTPTFIKVDAGSSFGTLITSSGFATVTVSAGQTYLVQLTYNTS